MIRRPPRSTLSSSSAASDVYKRQLTRGRPLMINTHRAVRLGITAAAIPLAILLSASSCQSANDAPVVNGNESGDQTPAEIIAMPDGFSNVATKCDKYGNRVYTGYHKGVDSLSIFVVPQDPSCKK